jgi:purine nucleosidase
MPSILLDTDPGVDDALALLYLHRHPDVELAGITTVAGNGSLEAVTRNARFLAERFGIAVPVARGAAESLEGHRHTAAAAVHGGNALGDITFADPAYPLDPRVAHRFIIDTVRQRPGEITLLAIGMLTNLARALIEDPGIIPLVRKVVIMGGAFMGHPGNRSPVAEANIFGDPDAADIVLTAAWPVQIIGLNVTERIVMTPEFLGQLRGAGTPETDFIWNVTRGYEAYYRGTRGVNGIYAHDPTAAVCAVDAAAFTFRSGPVRVIREGFAAGLTLQRLQDRVFPPNAWDGMPAQDAAVEVDAAAVLAAFAAPFARAGTTTSR